MALLSIWMPVVCAAGADIADRDRAAPRAFVVGGGEVDMRLRNTREDRVAAQAAGHVEGRSPKHRFGFLVGVVALQVQAKAAAEQVE
jgi:hypothetical protein